jgi:hypothetical protein
LFETMSSGCGFRKGCEDLFSGRYSDEQTGVPLSAIIRDHFVPSRGLSSKSAQSLCLRIYDEGACRYAVKTQGELMTATKHRELNTLGERIRTRLRQLFPLNPVQISAELLNIFPAIRDQLLSQKDTPCFKQTFDITQNGNLYVKERTPDFGEYRVDPTIGAMTAIYAATARCTHETLDSSPYRQALQNLIKEYNEFHSSAIFYDMLLKRYQHQAESHFLVVEDSPEDSLGKKYLGQELWQEYLSALKRLHHESPFFDCEAAGLKPVKALKAFKTLIEGTEAPTACQK